MIHLGDQTSERAQAARQPMHEWAVILAGGDGKRLQELSYKVSGDRRPKQFCDFFGGKSLLSHTRERLEPLFFDEQTIFVLNHAHEAYYGRELSDVPSSRKLVQPANRGTAPAIAVSVLEILQRDPGATIAFFPSDHHYFESSIFQRTIDRGLALAQEYEDRVLIVGAPASYPEVEYGWIQPGPPLIESLSHPLQCVSRFWEKPDVATARMLQRNGALWNTFVMIGTADAFLQLLAATLPTVILGINQRLGEGALDRLYSGIEPKDFSRDVLSVAPERLLVLPDGPSGWTDFGSPQRAMNLLEALAAS